MLCKFFSDNPDVKRVVDIGTGTGGLTLFFGMNMLQRGGKVLSFDIEETQSAQARRDFEKLNIDFRKMNVFADHTVSLVRRFIIDEPALIFCDNGNKGEEFPLYAKTLKPGDFIMAHDWPIEISEGNIDEFTHSILEPYLQEKFDEEETYILSMRRRQ
jgi:predicted O-methyltransferase YrrM